MQFITCGLHILLIHRLWTQLTACGFNKSATDTSVITPLMEAVK